MGSSLLKNLLGRTGIHVTATRRSHGLSETEGGKLEIVDYRERYLYLDRADVILSATESPHYTLTAGEAAKRLCTRKNRLFLDIAVPAEIDPEMGELPGCRLVSIDDFERLARENGMTVEDMYRKITARIRAGIRSSARTTTPARS